MPIDHGASIATRGRGGKFEAEAIATFGRAVELTFPPGPVTDQGAIQAYPSGGGPAIVAPPYDYDKQTT